MVSGKIICGDDYFLSVSQVEFRQFDVSIGVSTKTNNINH